MTSVPTDASAGAAPGTGSVRRRRVTPLLGLAGQVLNAATNAATAYTASFLLRPEAFGTFAVALGTVTVVLATGRGLVGTTLLAHLPGVDDARRPALVRSALGFAGLAALAATALLLAASVWIGGLVWFVPWIAAALLQDLARYLLLAQRRPGAALGLDVAWALAQATTLAVALLTGAPLTLGLLAAAWGIGALAGLVVFVAGPGRGLRPAHPGPWARTTRDVAGWFTASSVLGQVEVYAVVLLAGLLLGPAEAGGLRAVQLMTLQPTMVLLGAVLTLATPAMARCHAAGEPGALRAGRRRVTAAVLPVVAVVALVAAFADPLVRLLFGQYVGAADLVLPVAVQAAAFALTVPSLALLSGTRRAATAFALNAARLVAVVALAGVGAVAAGADGLVTGQAVATVAGLVATFAVVHPLVAAPRRWVPSRRSVA
ncbi:MATE family efflux transporter [Actinomycetospora sp. C-140]